MADWSAVSGAPGAPAATPMDKLVAKPVTNKTASVKRWNIFCKSPFAVIRCVNCLSPEIRSEDYAFSFAASNNLCTRPPGCDKAVMSLFSSAAGAVQMDQLNQ